MCAPRSLLGSRLVACARAWALIEETSEVREMLARKHAKQPNALHQVREQLAPDDGHIDGRWSGARCVLTDEGGAPAMSQRRTCLRRRYP